MMKDLLPADQEKFLKETVRVIETCAHQMEKCLESKHTLGAIQQASEMLKEMKTNALSPKAYYHLYVMVTDKLRLLEIYLVDEHKMNRGIPDLYIKVQYVCSIVPRLYLMITVGVYLIKCGGCPRSEVMRDLVEMCHGVQHPLRGLFLRNYLLQSLRIDLLPDVVPPPVSSGPPQDNCHATQKETCETLSRITESHSQANKSDVEEIPPNIVDGIISTDGTVADSISFLLFNFSEMNKLWVRMQHQGHSRDRERREQERQELCILVGTNLTRLSQLEAIDATCYHEHVLPALCEQLVQCGDLIAQEYLMDVIIQVFPDEFHLETLPQLLRVCNQLQPAVKPKQIVCGLIERLSQYAVREKACGRRLRFPAEHELPSGTDESNMLHVDNTSKGVTDVHNQDFSNLDLFNLFFSEVCRLIDRRVESVKATVPAGTKKDQAGVLTANGLPLEDIPPIYATLVRFAMLLCQGQCAALINKCLLAAAGHLAHLGVVKVTPKSALSVELLRLLCLPLGNSVISSSSGVNVAGTASSSSDAVTVPVDLRTVLNMSGFRGLVSLLDLKTTKYRLAFNILSVVLEREQRCRTDTSVTSSQSVKFRLLTETDLDYLFELIGGMLQPPVPASQTSIGGVDEYDEFTEAQGLVAGMLHLLGPEPSSADPDMCYRLLHRAQFKLAQAGPHFVRFHFPVIVFEGLQVLQTFAKLDRTSAPDWQNRVQRQVELIHRCITSLVAAEAPELALRLFLKSAIVMDGLCFAKRDSMTYEFISQALTLHEESVGHSRAQVESMNLIINTIYHVVHLETDSRRALCTQCIRAAAQLLRKHDQSRCLATGAHVYWPVKPMARVHVQSRLSSAEAATTAGLSETGPEGDSHALLIQLRDGVAVINCLKRARTLANDCIDAASRVQLYLDILDEAVGFRLNNCTQITDTFINELLSAIRELIDELEQTSTTAMITTHFVNTLNFIRTNQSASLDNSCDDGAENALSHLFSAVDIDPPAMQGSNV